MPGKSGKCGMRRVTGVLSIGSVRFFERAYVGCLLWV